MLALITGGSAGMGLEYARQLAARGYDLILVSNRQDELDSAVSTLSSQFPVSIRGRYQDLSLPSSADDLTAWCQSQQILPAIATPLYRMSPRLMNWGLKTGLVHSPKWLVKRALRAMFRGRRVVSPSLMNLWLPALISLLPGFLVAAIWKRLKK